MADHRLHTAPRHHLLCTGHLVADLTQLAARRPRSDRGQDPGERVELDAAERDRWLGEAERALALLEPARAESVLPEEPPNPDELEAWLLDLRREVW